MECFREEFVERRFAEEACVGRDLDHGKSKSAEGASSASPWGNGSGSGNETDMLTPHPNPSIQSRLASSTAAAVVSK